MIVEHKKLVKEFKGLRIVFGETEQCNLRTNCETCNISKIRQILWWLFLEKPRKT